MIYCTHVMINMSLQLSGTNPAARTLRWWFHQKFPPHPKASEPSAHVKESSMAVLRHTHQDVHHAIYLALKLSHLLKIWIFHSVAYPHIDFDIAQPLVKWLMFPHILFSIEGHTRPGRHDPNKVRFSGQKGDSCGDADAVVVMLMSNVLPFFRGILLKGS